MEQNLVVSKHCKNRYITRIKEIKKDVDYYRELNDQQIEEDILKMFQFSELIYKGKLGEHDYSEFYINQDIVLVKRGDIIVTLYRIYYKSDEEYSKEIIDTFTGILMRNNYIFDMLRYQLDSIVEEKNKYLNSEIKNENDKVLTSAIIKNLDSDILEIQNKIKTLGIENKVVAYCLIFNNEMKVVKK